MGRVITIKADGTTEVTEPAKKPTLEQMQQMVGGYIEQVPGLVKYNGETGIMICNEEGLLFPHRNYFNAKASMIARRRIVGDIFILIGWRL